MLMTAFVKFSFLPAGEELPAEVSLQSIRTQIRPNKMSAPKLNPNCLILRKNILKNLSQQNTCNITQHAES